jgi:hypothetical protein
LWKELTCVNFCILPCFSCNYMHFFLFPVPRILCEYISGCVPRLFIYQKYNLYIHSIFVLLFFVFFQIEIHCLKISLYAYSVHILLLLSITVKIIIGIIDTGTGLSHLRGTWLCFKTTQVGTSSQFFKSIT